jgi:hypothetical protein
LDKVNPRGFTADSLAWEMHITGWISCGIYPRVAVLRDQDTNIWTKGGIPEHDSIGRKIAKSISTIKSISMFFEFTQLYKRILTPLQPSPGE